MKPGDSIEICPEAISLTKDICNLLELSNGMSVVIDYGEDHSFSNSFRGLMKHKLIKDDQTLLDNVGNIDLTSLNLPALNPPCVLPAICCVLFTVMA